MDLEGLMEETGGLCPSLNQIRDGKWFVPVPETEWYEIEVVSPESKVFDSKEVARALGVIRRGHTIFLLGGEVVEGGRGWRKTAGHRPIPVAHIDKESLLALLPEGTPLGDWVRR